MPVSTAGRNLMLDALAAVAVWASLHDDDPGDTGDNEITGGAPAYARKPITWHPAALANLDNDANPVLDVPAGATVSHVGFWTASTAGVFLASANVADETYVGQGTYTIDDADVSVA